MPQIRVCLNRKAQNMITDNTLDDLCRCLTAAIEGAFGIEGKKDVAFDVFDVRYTVNESPVQIEVLYTAGADEYRTGKPFDPGNAEKMEAVSAIRNSFTEFLARNSIASVIPSVWIRPQYGSMFIEGKPSA